MLSKDSDSIRSSYRRICNRKSRQTFCQKFCVEKSVNRGESAIQTDLFANFYLGDQIFNSIQGPELTSRAEFAVDRDKRDVLQHRKGARQRKYTAIDII